MEARGRARVGKQMVDLSRSARSLYLVALVVLAGSGRSAARADEASSPGEVSTPTEPSAESEPAGYRELVDEALREYDAGNYEEARALLLRAHASFPNARTLRGLGKAEFELRNYPVSVAQLEAALASDVRPLDGKLRADTEQLLARARQFVAHLVIEARPAASYLLVDGLPSSAAPGQPLAVNVGDHVIEAQAPGYAPEKRRLSCRGGETQRVTIVFGRPLHEEEARGRARRWYKSPWLWGALGVAVAGGVTAGVLAARGPSESRARTDAYVTIR